MSRGEFGGSPSYGTLSSGNAAVSYGRPSRYQDGGELLHLLLKNMQYSQAMNLNETYI